MTKTRVKSIIVISLSLLFISLPILFSQTTKFSSIWPVVIIAMIIAVFMEQYLTFQFLKNTDSMVFANENYGITIFVFCMVLFFFICALTVGGALYNVTSIDGFSQSSRLLLLYCVMMFTFMGGFMSIGDNYLYTGYRYIPIGQIAHGEKIVPDKITWLTPNIYYNLTMKNGRTYKIHLRQSTMSSETEDLFDEKLCVNVT